MANLMFHLSIPPTLWPGSQSLLPSPTENSSKALLPHTLSHTHMFLKKRGEEEEEEWRIENEDREIRQQSRFYVSVQLDPVLHFPIIHQSSQVLSAVMSFYLVYPVRMSELL